MSSSNGYNYDYFPANGYNTMHRSDQYRYSEYCRFMDDDYKYQNEEKYLKKLQEDSQKWARQSQYMMPPPYPPINPPLPPTAPPDLLPPPPPPPPRSHISNQRRQFMQPPPLSQSQRRHNYSNETNNCSNHFDKPRSKPQNIYSQSNYSQNKYPQNNYLQNNYSPSNYQQTSYPQNNWSQRNGTTSKRSRPEEPEDGSESSRLRSAKKKKKPLSQNVPTKRSWDVKDAERALNIEKEFNKPFKNRSLIIKFPDLDLNKDIVAAFHSGIDNVHFQQPSTARFCFVTLKDDANADEIISALNTTKFGTGLLTAEFKKDREIDLNTGPNDIDPLTLYIGNLANEVTKAMMENLYPLHKRIDIGHAKKMKNTRYAFVTFRSVQHAIEGFVRTHKTELYAKSIIVRFRRLHGTIGMPGESKPQNPPKEKNATTDIREVHIEDEAEYIPDDDRENQDVLITSFKQEPINDDEEQEEEIDRKPIIDSNFTTPFLTNGVTVDDVLKAHTSEIKTEPEDRNGESKEKDEELGGKVEENGESKDSDICDLSPDVKDEPHFSFFSDGDTDSDSDGSSRVFSLPSRGSDKKPTRFGNPITNVFQELLRQATMRNDTI